MKSLSQLRGWARGIKRESYALYLACRDPRTPWYARVLAGAVVAYAFSPIDLIPDFIPVLGYLDDLLIVPLGIVLAVRMVPEGVMAECRTAAIAAAERPTSKVAALAIVGVWLVAAVLLGLFVRDRLLESSMSF